MRITDCYLASIEIYNILLFILTQGEWRGIKGYEIDSDRESRRYYGMQKYLFQSGLLVWNVVGVFLTIQGIYQNLDRAGGMLEDAPYLQQYLTEFFDRALVSVGITILLFTNYYLLKAAIISLYRWWTKNPNDRWDVESKKIISYIKNISAVGQSAQGLEDAFFIANKAYKDGKLELSCFDGSSFRRADPKKEALVQIVGNYKEIIGFFIQGSFGVYGDHKNVIKTFAPRHGAKGNTSPAYWH